MITEVTEDYVSFEIAKLLKEKGFDGEIVLWYDEDGKMFYQHKYDINRAWRVRANQEVYECPTLQMTIQWLRKVYGIIPIILTGDSSQNPLYYWFRIDKFIDGKLNYAIYREGKLEFKTYEEACEASIKYCLENLI